MRKRYFVAGQRRRTIFFRLHGHKAVYYLGVIGVILGLYWGNGKAYGNQRLRFRVQGSGLRIQDVGFKVMEKKTEQL